MPEDIMDRLNRLANAGRKPNPEPKRVFEMPAKEVEPPKGKGYLEKTI